MNSKFFIKKTFFNKQYFYGPFFSLKPKLFLLQNFTCLFFIKTIKLILKLTNQNKFGYRKLLLVYS